MEQWKDIPGFEGYYQVSNLGKVRSLDREITFRNGRKRTYDGCFLSPKRSGDGYRKVALSVGRNINQVSIHRLVMLAFVGPSDLEVNHKNGDKTDNRLENLEYTTRAENELHAYHTLGHRAANGARKSNAKLTDADVVKIRQEWATGKYTQKEIAGRFGISYRNVSLIVNDKAWKHVGKGVLNG